MDKYLIDFHKIIYHPERLALWLKAQNSWEEAKKLYPIYVEISLSSFCNHNCKFCAFDYLKKPEFANFQNLRRVIKEMANVKVKSVNFSGEGEPFLYPKIEEIIEYTSEQGIDIGVTTNGSLLEKELLEKILPRICWLRVSLDAATPTTHFKIHRPKVPQFEKILANLKIAVKIKKEKKLNCTLGVQMLLLPDNYKEVVDLAKLAKKIGLNYLIVKPYSQHPKSFNREYEKISYEKYLYLKPKLMKYKSKNFEIIFRERAMKKIKEKKNYKTCHAVPFFWAHLATNGDVYACGNFIGDERFKLGNYNENSFKEIWEGEKRKKLFEFLQKDFNVSLCRKACRMDEINSFLEKLKNPPPHVNFI